MRQPVPPPHRTFARAMRADSTKAENILWQALRKKQLEGLKVKRQVPLDGYILDFVCFEAKLIVEVDGLEPAIRDDRIRAEKAHSPMTKLEKIEQDIENLRPDELARFRAWYAEFDAANWDTAIEADAGSGRLDALAEEALAAHRAGRTRAF